MSKGKFNGKRYDFIFAGIGASASLLLIELERRNLLADLDIMILDPDDKSKNDKTYCFWAEPDESICTNLNQLINHSWKKIQVNDTTHTIEPLIYNHINSKDLYDNIKHIIKKHKIDRLDLEVISIKKKSERLYVETKFECFECGHVFDSRTPFFDVNRENQISIFQSFIGWKIEKTEGSFDIDTLRLMDFNIDQNDFTQFIYVLPYSNNKALVEITRFGSKQITDVTAEKLLNNYIAKNFGKFKHIDTERGCIPMSNGTILKNDLKQVICLGARNYMIKPSTGYAFKSMFYNAIEVANSIEKYLNN